MCAPKRGPRSPMLQAIEQGQDTESLPWLEVPELGEMTVTPSDQVVSILDQIGMTDEGIPSGVLAILNNEPNRDMVRSVVESFTMFPSLPDVEAYVTPKGTVVQSGEYTFRIHSKFKVDPFTARGRVVIRYLLAQAKAKVGTEFLIKICSWCGGFRCSWAEYYNKWHIVRVKAD